MNQNIQFFNAYNFHSYQRSVFQSPFTNKWLNISILAEIALMLFIVYVPAIHEPFNTFSLPLADWLIILGFSSAIFPVMELVKWSKRKVGFED